MGKFRACVSYAGYSFVDFLEIEANNRSQAVIECEKIKNENADFLNRCSANNVFVSKRIEDCRLCRLSFKEEMGKCEEVIEELKNYV